MLNIAIHCQVRQHRKLHGGGDDIWWRGDHREAKRDHALVCILLLDHLVLVAFDKSKIARVRLYWQILSLERRDRD